MVGAIIQARLSSTRLPGKVMMDIEGKTMLLRVIDRVKMASKIDKIIVATTTSQIDDLIFNSIDVDDIGVFRGDEKDVLSRIYHAAKDSNIQIVVRISADCPLIDPKIIDKVIEKFFEHKVSLATNSGGINYNRTFPVGLDVEVISFNALERAHFNATEEYERELVTPFIYKNDENIFYLENESSQSDYRFTVDTFEDITLIRMLYANSKLKLTTLDFQSVIEFLENNLDLVKINSHIEQKKYR
jgi:spore coat polysaccharide biosynthesis protein SpsF